MKRLSQPFPHKLPPITNSLHHQQTAGKLHAGHEAFTPRLDQYFGAPIQTDDFVQFLGSRCSTFRPPFPTLTRSLQCWHRWIAKRTLNSSATTSQNLMECYCGLVRHFVSRSGFHCGLHFAVSMGKQTSSSARPERRRFLRASEKRVEAFNYHSSGWNRITPCSYQYLLW